MLILVWKQTLCRPLETVVPKSEIDKLEARGKLELMHRMYQCLPMKTFYFSSHFGSHLGAVWTNPLKTEVFLMTGSLSFL